MSDLAKCILVVLVTAGIWFYKNYENTNSRKLTGELGQQLTSLQGGMPSNGKPIVLEFWGTYCGPCLQSIPHLNQLHAKYGRSMNFLAVSGEEIGTVTSFLKRGSIQYPVAVDPTGEFFRAWSIRGVPTMVILDANQKEIWRGHPMQLPESKLALFANR